ncbi:aminotransferase class V-fold PLP-dependent enzyme [Actinomadura darangshiensis]|uniref:Aminotransferase class V-fold PLP-dependent enzyme n=1 Tax=Actinomadura darangshiensis TaxID=705336 RepID=A0A4R4ZYA8_9ACTN|nr:aminotransferase class V-fold PLP-dependent enzyme [Actinomadura darangshiensis]TDD64273.1 aminotransferase class V-fold PLP-dependent enzyme [Actinomadura darangshiensis]
MDIDEIRADTPGCAKVAHLNNAGAALPPRPVIEAVAGHFALESTIGAYEAAEQNEAAIGRFYGAVAGLLGAYPDEIAYVENATRAWDMAFYSIPFAEGDRILTTTSEYSSNAIAYQQVAAAKGVKVEVVPDEADGTLSLDALQAELAKGNVRLVSLNHIPTHNGLVNPAAEVGRLCREHGVLYLLDACQSVGHLVVDVNEIGCDMLSATGRKFLRGPRGTGFLYVRRDILRTLVPPFLDLHAADWKAPDGFQMREDAQRFETWERYVAGQIGLGVAADYAADLGMPQIEARVMHLAARLREELAARPGITVLDRCARPSGIVTFTVDGHDPAAIKAAAREHGVNINVTTPLAHGYDPHAHAVAVRASVHYYNTEEELDRLLSVLT